jgi:DNA-binding transcriptional regulator LsrR (DeoR family)
MDEAIDPEEQVATRAAWLYFVAGLTQAQIGKKLGLNRTRVNRLLAHARDEGLVQINITGRLASCVELEEKLKQQYGLEDATVVPTPPDQDLIPQVIATAARLHFRRGSGTACRLASAGAVRSASRSSPYRGAS